MTDQGMVATDKPILQITEVELAEQVVVEPVKLTRLAERIIDSLSIDDRTSVLAYVTARQAAIRAELEVSDVDDTHPSPSFRWAFGAVVATMANERPFLLIASFVCLNANLIAALVYLIRKFIA